VNCAANIKAFWGRRRDSQQEAEVALTKESFAARGFTSSSRASLRIPTPQGVHDLARGSE